MVTAFLGEAAWEAGVDDAVGDVGDRDAGRVGQRSGAALGQVRLDLVAGDVGELLKLVVQVDGRCLVGVLGDTRPSRRNLVMTSTR